MEVPAGHGIKTKAENKEYKVKTTSKHEDLHIFVL